MSTLKRSCPRQGWAVAQATFVRGHQHHQSEWRGRWRTAGRWCRSVNGNVSEALSAILGAGRYTFNYIVTIARGAAFVGNLTVSPVPIPAALPLFAAALGGLGFVGWRKRKAARQGGAMLPAA